MLAKLALAVVIVILSVIAIFYTPDDNADEDGEGGTP